MQESIVKILLFISTIISFGAGLIVLGAPHGNKSNRYLSIVLISGSLWCFSILLTLLSANLFVSNLSFFATGIMFLSINLYVRSFAGLNFKKYLYIYSIPALLISFAALWDKLLVKQIQITDGYIKVIQYGPFYWFYIAFLAVYMLLLVVNTHRAFKVAVGLQKLQIIYLIIGMFLASLFGVIFNLILPAFNFYAFNSLGPVFIIFISAASAYAATRHFIYDRQVVFSELWAFFLILLGIVWLVTNATIFNFILFLAMTSIAILFIRSVISEAEKKAILLQDKQELERADRAKDEFIQMAQHELNTPIGIIEGRLSMVIDENMGGFNERQKEYLKPVYSDAKRLAMLTKALVEVSEIDQNTVKLIPEKFDLIELINKEIKSFQKRAADKNLALEKLLPETLILSQADKRKIQKIINILIGNALKFTFSGSVKVTVSANQNDVEISIADTGVGIEPDDLPHVFEKFFQPNRFDEKLPQEQQGTGLSLYIIKHWIELHQGKIDVVSQKNKGTTFTFSLPI